MSKPAARLRLDRLLGNLGYGSRKEIQGLARAGGVVLDGAELTDASAKIEVTADLPARMTVQGAALDPPPGMVLMLHKPLGVTCSHKEAGALVYDLLPARWRRRDPALSTVGRLDKDTSGILLLTDDGGLLHRIIAPSAKVEKRYRATLARPLDGLEIDLFASGMLVLENDTTPLLPARLEPISETEAFLTITEGRYPPVRRMFAAAGNHVNALHRDQVGGLALPGDLAAGQYRILDAAEVRTIFGG